MKSRTAYLSASADGATQIGLHVMVYNSLARDLLIAGDACRKHNIPGRCSASSRALLLLGHLETWVSHLDDPQLVGSLLTFYQGLRQEIVCLQAKGSPADFDRLSEAVQGVRGAWQAKEQALTNDQALPQNRAQPPQPESTERYAGQTTSAWCA